MIAIIILFVSAAAAPKTVLITEIFYGKKIPFTQVCASGIELNMAKPIDFPIKKVPKTPLSVRKEVACLFKQQKSENMMDKKNYKRPDRTQRRRFSGRKGLR